MTNDTEYVQGNPVKIHTIGPEEFPEYIGLIEEFVTSEEHGIPGRFNKRHILKTVPVQIRKKRLNVKVAKNLSKPVGMIAGIVFEDFYSGQRNAEELMWYVKEDWRGQKIGKLLMKRFEQWARKMGVKNVYMSDLSEEKRLSNFYQNNGYKFQETTYRKEI